jgi:hypothetical protein
MDKTNSFLLSKLLVGECLNQFFIFSESCDSQHKIEHMRANMKIGRARNNVDTPDASKASNSRFFVKNENVKSVDTKQAIGNSQGR